MPSAFVPGATLTAAQLNAVVLTPTAKTANYVASDGDLVKISTGKTVTLPAATSEFKVGVIATDTNLSNGVTSAGGAKIIGPGLAGGIAAGTVVPLGALDAFVILESDGTDWYVIAGAADSGSIVPGFTNSWGAASGTNVAYRKIGNVVRLRGGVAGGTGNTAAFTLPSGYRPISPFHCAGLAENSAAICLIQVSTSGAVTPSVTDSVEIGLDVISFAVDA